MAAAPQSNYKRGTMDIREQQSTFALFWALTKWGIICTAVLMIILAYVFT